MQDLTVFIANHMALAYAFATILVLLMIVEFIRMKRKLSQIPVTEAVQLMNHKNAVVIDIRSQDQYRQGHIIDAVSFPARELMDNPKKLDKYKNKPLIIACHTGTESQKIATMLAKQGYNIYSLAGGMRAWGEADMPIIRNPS